MTQGEGAHQRSREDMGGIQAREGSLAEVHAVRGGQLILRVASSQTSLSSGGGAGGGGGGSGGGAGGGAGGGWMAGGENASALNGSSFKYLVGTLAFLSSG